MTRRVCSLVLLWTALGTEVQLSSKPANIWRGDAVVLSAVDGSVLTLDAWTGHVRGRADPSLTGGPLLRGSDTWVAADGVTQRIVPALDGTLFSLLEHPQSVPHSMLPALFQLEPLPLQIPDLVDRPVSLCFSPQDCGFLLGHQSTQLLALDPHSGAIRPLQGSHTPHSTPSVLWMQRVHYVVHQVHVQSGHDMWNVTYGHLSSLEFSQRPQDPVCVQADATSDSILPWIYLHPETTANGIQTILALDPHTLQILWSHPLQSIVATAHGIVKRHAHHGDEFQWSVLHLVESLPLEGFSPTHSLPGMPQFQEEDVSLVPMDPFSIPQESEQFPKAWNWILTHDTSMENYSPLIIRPAAYPTSTAHTIPSSTSLALLPPSEEYLHPYDPQEEDTSPFIPEDQECLETYYPWEYEEENYDSWTSSYSFPRYTISHKTEHGLFLSWRLVSAIVSCMIAGILGGRIVYMKKKQKWIAESNTPQFLALFPNSNSEDDARLPSPLLLTTQPTPPPPISLPPTTNHIPPSTTVSHMDGIPLVRYLRYRSEFDEIEALGQGGFGTVFKCCNKLDGREYAIKKVAIPSPLDKHGQWSPQLSKKFHRVLREVKILALLDHPNIVRYYTAWLEMEEDEKTTSEVLEGESWDPTRDSSPSRIAPSSDTRMTPILPRGYSSNLLVGQAPVFSQLPRYSSEDDLGFVWERSLTHVSQDPWIVDESSSPSIVEAYPSLADPSLQNPTKPSSMGSSRVDASQQSSQLNSNKKKEDIPEENFKMQKHILYIQMQLSKKTLLDYFAARHAPGSSSTSNHAHQSIDILLVLRMFAHIARGVNHVHRQGLIHRDLKPSNCFMDDSDLVKIGDFGLSRESGVFVDDEEGSTSKRNIETMENTAGIGTSSYASPEQINGSDYDASTDIYSLGIILFELCYPMITGMERFKAFEGIRKSTPQFPALWYKTVAKQFPVIHNLVTSMISHNPKYRPSASQVSNQIEALLNEYKTVLLLNRPGVQRQDGSVFLRVEAIDCEGILARMIQTIKGVSPEIIIAQYSLQGHENKALMEFALILRRTMTSSDDADTTFESSNREILEKIIQSLEKCKEVKLVRQLNNTNTPND